MEIREDIKAYLRAAWPFQFRGVEDDSKGRATKEDLEYFRDGVIRIVGKGIGWDQIQACLVSARNRKGGERLQRGEILDTLWQLVPRSAPKPIEQAPEVDIFRSHEGPYAMYARDREAAIKAYPWILKPWTSPRGVRYESWERVPFFHDMVRQRKSDPVP